jgi:hypothetical protein
MRRLIREIGRTPIERSTTYATLRRFDDPALDPPSLEPKAEPALSGPTRWRLQQERAQKAAAEPSEVRSGPPALQPV